MTPREAKTEPQGTQRMSERYVLPFREIDLAAIDRVGGKKASLGEMIQGPVPLGVRVPDGFAVTADAFRIHLRSGGLNDRIYGVLDKLDISDLEALAETGRRIRQAPLSELVARQILEAYADFSAAVGEEGTDVAVRSSATAEDLPTASFSGQQDTFLNVRGTDALLSAVRSCMASLFTNRAIVYRSERDFSHRDVALSVGVQKMVRSDLGSAGVIFTLDTEGKGVMPKSPMVSGLTTSFALELLVYPALFAIGKGRELAPPQTVNHEAEGEIV